MESFVNLLQGLIAGTVPTIILLGLLIFVHELGHFLVAKYYKVRVEVFSLGFGPKLFKFKRGDTVYAISLIPLGGYVKMFGDDPTAEVSSEQRPYSFIHKPVAQRIAVVLAGPLMNLLFALILFGAIAKVGETALAPKIGDVDPQTAAYAAGFRSGDTVVNVGGQNVRTWDDFEKTVESSADKALGVQVTRADSGETANLQATPKLVKNKNILSWDRQIGEIEGLQYLSRASIVGVRTPESPAGKSGLLTGDIVQSINGTKITKWRELQQVVEKNSGAATLEMEVERGALDETKKETSAQKITIAVPADVKGKPAAEVLQALGLEFPDLYLGRVEKKSPAEEGGLKKGDRIVAIDGKPVNTFEEVTTSIRSYGQTHKDGKSPLAVGVLREGKEVDLKVAPNLNDAMTAQGKEEKAFKVGIMNMGAPAQPTTFELSFSNPIEIATRAAAQTWKWTSLTVLSFVRLFQAEVSPKNIGGFLSIGKMANKSFQIGLSAFLNVMAIISINLFILNLLPVPVLDGGHLVFYSIEALRGAPLSMRKMEIAQQVGLVLLLALMVFALFNDVTR
jgi:regulator of sigma E protease